MKLRLASFSLTLAATAAYATPGMPHLIAVAPGEFYATVAVMDEANLASFVVADPGASCEKNFAELPVSYNADAISLRIGTQDYILLTSGLEGYGNTLGFADAAGCAALDMTKLTSMKLVWQNKLLPFAQQIMSWNVPNNVVTFRSPLFDEMPSAVGYVMKTY